MSGCLITSMAGFYSCVIITSNYTRSTNDKLEETKIKFQSKSNSHFDLHGLNPSHRAVNIADGGWRPSITITNDYKTTNIAHPKRVRDA